MIRDISYIRYNMLANQYNCQFRTSPSSVYIGISPNADRYLLIHLYTELGGIPYAEAFRYNISFTDHI